MKHVLEMAHKEKWANSKVKSERANKDLVAKFAKQL